MSEDYRIEIKESSRELTAKERIMIKQLTGAVRIDEATQDNELVINPVAYAILAVHNERSKGDKDYETMAVINNDGTIYLTGSQSFRSSIIQFWDDYLELLESGENASVKVFRMPSKNYKGKEFITAAII